MSSGKNDRRAKDKSMAAYLKKHNVIRTTTACPHCHKSTGIGNGLLAHIISCRGTKRVFSRSR